MPKLAISVENLTKEYRLGIINHGTLRQDLVSWWTKQQGANVQEMAHRQFRESDRQSLFQALHNISFTVPEGEVLGIIGQNGAGKSTILKVLSRITEPTSGQVKIKGRVASLLEVGTGFHPELTGRENIFLNGAILGMTKVDSIRNMDEIIDFSGVEKFLDTPVKRYSSGMFVRLAFAVAAHLEPEVLLVDEVLAVGDVTFQKKCLGKMQDIGKEGRTILFVSHNMAAIQNLCERTLLLKSGEVVAHGKTGSIVGKYLEDSQSLASSSLAERKDRQGNGALRFKEVRFLDSESVATNSLQSGRATNFAFIFEARKDTALDNIEFAIRVDSTLGERIVHFSTEVVNVVLKSVDADSNAIILEIPRLPLVPGSYSYTIFCKIGGVIADWIQNAGFFHVHAGDFFGSGRLPSSGQGSVMIDHSFRLERL